MQAKNHRSVVMLISVVTVLIFMLASIVPSVAQNQEMKGSAHAAGQKATAKVVDIVRDPSDVPSPIGNRPPAVVRVTLTAKEVVGRLDPASGAEYRYWTFNGKVPGPMIRVRQGDMVEVTLNNDPTSHMAHSVDFHAALGPGGGAAFSEAVPGQTKTFSFQATTPGLFVYHCGTPMIAEHIANGMYGLILVEPQNGLSRVDHEYYVMQGEMYTAKPKGTAGMQDFSGVKLMQESPEYFVFNGAVDALTTEHPLKANAGETVRIFFGDAGPDRPSSLHVVGEIFTKEYVAGSLTTAPENGVQTALVAPGSAAILELKATTPGKFNFMDHAMSRMAKGLMGTIEVAGQPNLALMHAGPAAQAGTLSASASGMTKEDEAAATSEAVAVNVTATPPNERSSTSEIQAKARKPSASKPFSAMVGLLSKSPTEIVGCLNYQVSAVTLKSWPSGRVYRLQARPLMFAQQANHLVYVTGRVGSVVPDSRSTPDDTSFVVDTVDQLSPNCGTRITQAMLRTVTAKDTDSAELSGAAGAPASVGMNDMSFLKPKLTIKVGQAVVWKNTSQTVHNVVDDASQAMNAADVQLPEHVKPFGSGLLQPGQTYSHVFTVPGTYRYVCTLHEGMGMKGEVIVK